MEEFLEEVREVTLTDSLDKERFRQSEEDLNGRKAAYYDLTYATYLVEHQVREEFGKFPATSPRNAKDKWLNRKQAIHQALWAKNDCKALTQ